MIKCNCNGKVERGYKGTVEWREIRIEMGNITTDPVITLD